MVKSYFVFRYFRQSSIVLKHLLQHPNVKGLIPASTSGTGREKIVKRSYIYSLLFILSLEFLIMMTSSGSTVVEHLPYHPMVKGLIPASTSGTGREKIVKRSYIYSLLFILSLELLTMITSSGSTVVEHLLQHPKVKALNPVDGAKSERQKNCKKKQKLSAMMALSGPI